MTAPTLRPIAFVVFAIVLGVSASVARLEGRAQSARDRYDAAMALDRDARAAGDREDDAPDSAIRAARRALVLYESVVRRFPTSGYCDNALLRGGDLARWIFARSGRAADRAAAAKYYAWLVREYPGSGLRGQARLAARALETTEVETPRRTTGGAAGDSARGATVATASPAVVPTLAAGPAPAAASATSPVLRGIERAVLNGGVRVTLLLDREIPFAHELIAGPPRAFVDLFGAVPAADLRDKAIRYEADAVRQVRVGRRPNATRVVLDLDGAPAVSVFTLYNPFRVVIDAERPASATTASAFVMPAAAFTPTPTPVPSPARLAPSLAAPTLAASPLGTASAPHAVLRDDVPAAPRDENDLVPAVVVPVVLPDTAPYEPALALPIAAGGSPHLRAPAPAPPAPAPAPVLAPTAAELLVAAVDADGGADVDPAGFVPSVPAANGDGSFSLARQLGLGISRIVIDPGHGGHDPGTLTGGTNEARLVLDVALRLEKLLKKETGLEVVLTRRTDIFIPLEQRTAIANREGADLFLSIHANASRDASARGVETYFLSFASNPEAEAVAARENATSASDMHNLPSIVRAIALNNKLDESRDLARMVQQSLSGRLAKTNPGLRSRGVKKAPFVVLIGAGMPSVLAEIGFITNKQEAALVKTPLYRQKIAESLHAAVMQYRRALKRQTSVAAR